MAKTSSFLNYCRRGKEGIKCYEENYYFFFFGSVNFIDQKEMKKKAIVRSSRDFIFFDKEENN